MGKVERFHCYLCGNFYVPLTGWLEQSSLVLEVDTANAEMGKWLREVANQRVHLVTGAAAAVLFEQRECAALQPLRGFAISTQPATFAQWAIPNLAASLLYPLSTYYLLATADRGVYARMNLQQGRIDAHCQTFKLEGLMQCYWAAAAGEAANKDWSFLDYLEHVLARERDTGQARSRQTRVRMAGFPAIRALGECGHSFVVGAPRS